MPERAIGAPLCRSVPIRPELRARLAEKRVLRLSDVSPSQLGFNSEASDETVVRRPCGHDARGGTGADPVQL